jgi:branched-subunit amino acid transport protein
MLRRFLYFQNTNSCSLRFIFKKKNGARYHNILLTTIINSETIVFVSKFHILLTVHHIMFPDKWPTWRTILFYVFISIFNSLHVSSTSCSSSGETNCFNTASGSCHSVLMAVSCAVRKWISDLRTTQPPTVTRGCIDTICLSWWWARCARNM